MVKARICRRTRPKWGTLTSFSICSHRPMGVLDPAPCHSVLLRKLSLHPGPNSGVWLSIGQCLKAQYDALEPPVPPHLAALVRQLEMPIPGEAAPHSGMMSPTDSEMISPTIPR